MAPSLLSNTSFLPRRPDQPKKKMSITQTYYLAHTARSKLSKEAARSDHDLRLLVGHANLLDSLMLDLANAEREQEQWFNNTVRNATKKAQPSHIRWADTIEEESMEDDVSDDDSDMSDDDYSDYDEEEEDDEEKFEDLTAIYTAAAVAKPLRRAASPPALISMNEVASDEEEEEEEAARLTLTRSPSRTQSPPGLTEDLSSDDEEDSMPPSPEQLTMDAFASTSGKKQPATQTNLLSETESQSLHNDSCLLILKTKVLLLYDY
ncbi:conserved hypothetical protein [Talaromyces stipitatus ATCC 10500]|uniref:Uncharacterized protein n=1 Tax=Talaromyces stipitatus (strain ATCC 10500 / CBS 375.48 / QM 6759 / NRRL 1006) TaxID=441959 RepID=B8MAZ9_TALSN|nr:uncharacterized protein TSTA_124270 [Talaromyces stipitatus ATCC 10500]EED18700.1 conserved hypothetical protein [Talaromyces stipitatus ATCC 10500]